MMVKKQSRGTAPERIDQEPYIVPQITFHDKPRHTQYFATALCSIQAKLVDTMTLTHVIYMPEIWQRDLKRKKSVVTYWTIKI